MDLERQHQVAADEHDHSHEQVIEEEELASPTSFTSEGAIPAVAEHAHEHEVRPPQPSASDRAYGSGKTGKGSKKGKGGAPKPTEAPVLYATATRVVHGVTIVAPPGCHANAPEAAAEIVRMAIGRNQHAQLKLSAARTTIVIIPARTKMTDLPQFTSLRGKQTFDKRPWENVRGSGGLKTPDGTFAIGVAEENLIEVKDVISGYAKGYSIGLHELAHALESQGLNANQKARLDALYKQQQGQDKRVKGTHHDAFTDSYSAENKHEYFAQSTNAFFGRNAGREKVSGATGKLVQNHNSKQWLYQNDPDMYAFLVELYETSLDSEGHRIGD